MPLRFGQKVQKVLPQLIPWNKTGLTGRLLGVFDRIFASLAGEKGKPEQLMIDATHLKAHRTAASLLKKGLFPAVSDARRAV